MARLADTEDLLGLLWGPRIDRGEAAALLARRPQAGADLLARCLRTADRWDSLPAWRQQRVRQRLLRAMDNAACPASC